MLLLAARSEAMVSNQTRKTFLASAGLPALSFGCFGKTEASLRVLLAGEGVVPEAKGGAPVPTCFRGVHCSTHLTSMETDGAGGWRGG